MKKSIAFFMLDLSLKFWANNKADDVWSGCMFVCHNSSPFRSWTLLAFVPLIWLSVKSKKRFWVLLLWAGVISNTFERLIWGWVTDMIPIPIQFIFPNISSPITNLADIYMVISAVVLLYDFRDPKTALF